MGLIEQLNLRRAFQWSDQRLAIATAIVANPAVLIMDDPTSEMDPLDRRQFSNGWPKSKRRLSSLSPMEIDDLCEVADVVWVLHEGQVVARAGRVSV